MADRNQIVTAQVVAGAAPLDEIEVMVIVRDKNGDVLAAGAHTAMRSSSASPMDLAKEAAQQAAKDALARLSLVVRDSNG